MIFLADTPDPLEQVAEETGLQVGCLLTPLTRRKRKSDTFAIDNGAFARFEYGPWSAILERERDCANKCLFVVLPDVVGSARRTLELFERFKNRSVVMGYKLALCAQDGQEDLSIPWEDMAAVFIGGSTEFKMSAPAFAIAKTARALDKWVHVGRVNTSLRMDAWEDFADSFDGTGVSRYTHMRKALKAQSLFKSNGHEMKGAQK